MYANQNYKKNSRYLDPMLYGFEYEFKTIKETAMLLKDLDDLMYNPMYDLQARVAVLHDENNATIFYDDGTQFELERV